MPNHENKTPNNEISGAIQVLERRDLDKIKDIDSIIYTKSASSSSLGTGIFRFLRIKSISKSFRKNKSDVERYMTEDVLSGIHSLKTPFIYLIIGSRLSVNVYVGIFDMYASINSHALPVDVLSSSLESTFPSIELELLSRSSVDKQILQFFQSCKSYGIMTGIPTPKLGIEEHGLEQIERLIRGLYRQEFGYMVIADPVNDMDVIEAFDDIASVIMDKSSLIKESKQYTQTSRITKSGETINRSVQYYVELLEVLLDKLKLAKSQGMWRTITFFFSPFRETVGKTSNLLKTVFSGDKSTPEAIRSFVFNTTNTASILNKFNHIELDLNFHPAFAAEHPLRKIIKHKFTTVLNSRDLATLTHLPKEEMPGYDVKDTARFGVCLPENHIPDSLVIGEIIDRGGGTGNYYEISKKDIVKHGLIVGVTGSGKTNTCLNILDQLWNGNSRVPFLVIEPAKSEYRDLLNINGYKDLQIFTLGDEMTSPFRLNPFELIKGVKLQTHIDNLRAVFNASFVMYSPMPYVLERCIHEIYMDKGWDLITNRNRFGENNNPYGIFPTMTDLYNKIDPVVDAMGYEDRLTMDIKASLKVRVGSLRIGGKGSMLDSALSIPMDRLLKKPTIIELQNVGDDEEKAFLIGLLIARLYEYREIESKQYGSNMGLRHVTLLEEAHRLLTKTSSDLGNLENVNTKAKAVESLCNILSEIRAFGEGILIAEQIPSKLAQDAIKNTNLKVMHRIVAKDDRDLIGYTMNLNEEQNKFISIMDRGDAVVFSEGFSEPFLIKFSHFQSTHRKVNSKIKSVKDNDVRRFMAKNLLPLDYIFGRHSGCRQCQHKCAYRDTSTYMLSKPSITRYFNKFIFGIIEYPDRFKALFPGFKDVVMRDLKQSLKDDEEAKDIMFCFLVNAGETYIRKKGIKYNLVSDKIFILLGAYYDFINSYFAIPIKTQLSNKTESFLQIFQGYYKKFFFLDKGPFPGCDEFCMNKCLFRYEVEPSVKDKTIDEKLFKTIKSGNDAKSNLKKLCMNTAHNLTIINSERFVENIALCFFIQKSVQWSVQEITLNIKRWFFDK